MIPPGPALLILAISAAAALPPTSVDGHVLAVLDPADMDRSAPDPGWGAVIRRSFSARSGWNIIPADTVARRFREYNLDPRTACYEFQCAFDAGNILQAEFVAVGTVSRVGGLYAYTLNLVHIPSSQVVWSRAGQVPASRGSHPGAALEGVLGQTLAGLRPENLDIRRAEKRGMITVLDLSQGSAASRVMAERVSTHLYATRHYDIMSRRELDELLAAMDIKPRDLAVTDSAMLQLGGKMGISHLVYSRLADSAGSFHLKLALFDVGAKSKLREWPAQPSRDFQKLLQFEDKFFTSLLKTPGGEDMNSPGKDRRWAYGGVGLGVVLSASLGFLAYSQYRDADKHFTHYQDARSGTSAAKYQQAVEDSERNTWVFGVLSGAALLGGGALLVFSF